MVSDILPAYITNLNLGDEEAHPRRLLNLPGSFSPTTIAYGGIDGSISYENVPSDHANKDQSENGNKKWEIGRQFDEAVRAVSISPDGGRVAVGFEDGTTQIFVYNLNLEESENSTTSSFHPFIQTKSKSKTDITESGEDDSGEDMYGDLLTQSDFNIDSSTSLSETSFSGPRLSVPIRDLQFHPTQKNHLVVASESTNGFFIVDVTSEKTLNEVGRLLESEASTQYNGSGVRAVAFQPRDGNIIATLGMDGRLCLWSCPKTDTIEVDWEILHQDKIPCVSKDLGEMVGSDPMDRSCRPVWSEDGKILCLPGSIDVQLRKKDDWRKQLFISSISDEGHKDSIVGATWGTNKGKNILITSGRDKRIMLWHIFSNEEIGVDPGNNKQQGQYLGELKFDNSPMSLFQYNPTEIIYCKEKRKIMITMENGALVVYSAEDLPSEPPAMLEHVDEENEVELNTQPISQASSMLGSEIKKSKTKRISKSSVERNEDDDDDDLLFDKKPDSSSNTHSARSQFISDEADEGSKGGDDEDEKFDDVNVKVLGNGTEDKQDDENQEIEFDVPDDTSLRSNENYPPQSYRLPTVTEAQPPFAPSATPLVPEISRRILCWNNIGTITHRRDSLEDNIVDISFVDSIARRPVTFPESYGFIIGSLGDDGAIFASDIEEDDNWDDHDNPELKGLNISDTMRKAILKKKKSGSRIYFHRYETIGSRKDKDWSLTLPNEERVLGCASGLGWASVMTSKRFLRLFSSAGVQSNIIWLPGDPVTMIGRGRFLAVIYHISSPLQDSTQSLGYLLMNITNGTTISSGPLSCVSSGGSITWAGFSEDFSFYVMDSQGILSILANTHGWHWTPILNTMEKKKSKDDHFWPVTVTDGKLICVPLKGGNEYPDAARRPVTTSLVFKVPVVKGLLGGNSFALEETMVRAAIALKQKKLIYDIEGIEDPSQQNDLEDQYSRYQTNVDKLTLKLFFNAVKSGKVEIALDLIERLHSEKSYDIAINAAEQCNRIQLSDEIAALKDIKFSIVDEEFDEMSTQDDYQSENEFQSMTQSVSRNVSPDEKERNLETNKRSREPELEEDSNRKIFPTKKMLKVKNPFAKRKMESPLRPSPKKKSSGNSEGKSQTSLSRLSTFGAQARQEVKKGKTIL